MSDSEDDKPLGARAPAGVKESPAAGDRPARKSAAKAKPVVDESAEEEEEADDDDDDEDDESESEEKPRKKASAKKPAKKPGARRYRQPAPRCLAPCLRGGAGCGAACAAAAAASPPRRRVQRWQPCCRGRARALTRRPPHPRATAAAKPAAAAKVRFCAASRADPGLAAALCARFTLLGGSADCGPLHGAAEGGEG
jgi:hypothetical protein